MSHYESYRDVLNEHATRRHGIGSSVAIVLIVLVAAIAVSVI
jgi:hypothetical protein